MVTRKQSSQNTCNPKLYYHAQLHMLGQIDFSQLLWSKITVKKRYFFLLNKLNNCVNFYLTNSGLESLNATILVTRFIRKGIIFLLDINLENDSLCGLSGIVKMVICSKLCCNIAKVKKHLSKFIFAHFRLFA